MALKRDKDAIEIQGDDAIKRNRLFFDFILRMFNLLNQLYEKEKGLLIDKILKYQSRKTSAKESTSKPSPKKGCFADETNKTSQANSDSYKSNSNTKKRACYEGRSSEEEDVGIRNSRRKCHFQHTSEESNGKGIEEEKIKLPKCGRKGDIKHLNEKKRKTLVKRKILESVSVGGKVELINSMRK